MASPLILKAQFIAEERFLPIALLLPTDHLTDLQVTLSCVEGSHANPFLVQTATFGGQIMSNIKTNSQKALGH